MNQTTLSYVRASLDRSHRNGEIDDDTFRRAIAELSSWLGPDLASQPPEGTPEGTKGRNR